MIIVPYKNSPEMAVALLRNDMQMQVEFPPAMQGQVKVHGPPYSQAMPSKACSTVRPPTAMSRNSAVTPRA